MDNAVKIHGAALGLLGQREHSRRELLTKLAERFNLPIDAMPLQQCLDKLAADGYQSDERFAEVFVRSRRARGYGPVFIEQELRRRGVNIELVTDSVRRSDEGWLAAVSDVKRKKFGAGLVTALQEKAKVARFLQYRGFLPMQINQALRG
ncbi:MAG: regulatory protein RecX [Pseudomonadales bacterium]